MQLDKLIIGLATCLALGCSPSGQTRSVSEQLSSDSEQLHSASSSFTPYTAWTVQKCVIYGKESPEHVGHELHIKTDGTALRLREGESETIEFQIEAGQETEIQVMQIVPFRIATRDDAFARGGAGPRRGALRFLENGQMEILEAGSADSAGPQTFDDVTSANMIYYRLAR